MIIGPTKVGNSFLASALVHAACKADQSLRNIRLPRLQKGLALRKATRKKKTDAQSGDLLEIAEDRYDKQSMLIASIRITDRPEQELVTGMVEIRR